MTRAKFADVDSYIASFPKDVQLVLKRVRATIRKALPAATECISYSIPTYRLSRDDIHFGAFKTHIGLYPPVRDPKLQARVARYRGEKGNLRFSLDEPMPHGLIAQIAKSQTARGAGKAAPAKNKKTKKAPRS